MFILKHLLKHKRMNYTKITAEDLAQIKNLQLEGWPDITNDFRFYIDNDFCYPIKATIDDCIVGVGVSMVFNNKTAWLDDIIVEKNNRNKGIGFQIVDKLLTDLNSRSIESVLLIATELGEPVYKKSGFRLVSDYIFFNREQEWNEISISKHITPYKEEFYDEILKLDKKISGENREQLLKMYIENCLMYLDNNILKGFFMPNLGEGLIFADNPLVGIELMKMKYSTVNKAVLPEENIIGIGFLKSIGFIESESMGKRMILGKDVSWKPDCFFSRIGANFG